MSQPPYSPPDDNFPATDAAAGSRPTQPAVPPLPPMPPAPGTSAAAPWDQQPAPAPTSSWDQQVPSAPQTTWNQQPTPAPWDQQPQTSPFGTYAAPYAQPQYPQYGQQLGALPAGKKTLGVVALVFGLVASFGSAILALALAGPAARKLVEYQNENGAFSDFGDIDLSYFSSVRDSVLWLEVSLYAGTIAGIAAIVLGIIAIAQRKGRGLGVTALILGIVGPLIWAIGASIGAIMDGLTF